MSQSRYTDEAMQIKASRHLGLLRDEKKLWAEKRDWEARRAILDGHMANSTKDMMDAILNGDKTGRVMVDGVLFTADLNRVSSCQLMVEPCRIVQTPNDRGGGDE